MRAGQEPGPTTLVRGVPIYRRSSYLFRDTAHAADLLALKEPGNVYTRIMKTTQDVLEKRVAALEGGSRPLGVFSGTSAVYYPFTNICSAGDEVVSSNNLYGGKNIMFESILPRFGKKVNFIEGLKLFSCLVKVGDAKSLALNPASTSHSQLSEEHQRASLLTSDLVRPFVVLENIDDILKGIDQTLK